MFYCQAILRLECGIIHQNTEMHNISQASLKDVVLSDMSTSDSASTHDLMTLATMSVVQSGVGQTNISSTYPIPYVKTRGWIFDDRSSSSDLSLTPASIQALRPCPQRASVRHPVQGNISPPIHQSWTITSL